MGNKHEDQHSQKFCECHDHGDPNGHLSGSEKFHGLCWDLTSIQTEKNFDVSRHLKETARFNIPHYSIVARFYFLPFGSQRVAVSINRRTKKIPLAFRLRDKSTFSERD